MKVPYKVKDRFSKYFDIEIGTTTKRVSIDRLKPAFVANKGLTYHPIGFSNENTKVTPSGHRVRFLA